MDESNKKLFKMFFDRMMYWIEKKRIRGVKSEVNFDNIWKQRSYFDLFLALQKYANDMGIPSDDREDINQEIRSLVTIAIFCMFLWSKLIKEEKS